jgi:phage portal protein BeeE
VPFTPWEELSSRNEAEIRFSGAKSGVSNPSQWLQDWVGAGKSSTGIDVHETTAMQSVAVYACVKVLAETMASLPLPVYKRLPAGKEMATQHPLFRLLHDFPNREMTASDFRQTMMTHLLLWGNAYAEIERDNAGRPIALWPLRPDRMQIWRSFETPYDLEYWY